MLREKWLSYCQLMRIHKPVGFFLLWFPCAWGLWAAAAGRPAGSLLVYFVWGTLLMRSAGCIINDIADRHIDSHVSRTATRPLAERRLSISEALVLLFFLLAVALLILLQLPGSCLGYALIALTLTAIYPFCKRFISAPQLVLGLAFSVAIPMAYAASGQPLNFHCFCLVLINLLWVVSYDTMYAMVDREDDLKIGVYSTAVFLGDWDRLILFFLQLSFHGLWLFAFWDKFSTKLGLFFWLLAALILIYQQMLVHTRQPKSCFKAFNFNVWYGLWMWMALAILL